jgi:hypothetical protein
MAREGLEVADILRHFGAAFRDRYEASPTTARRRAMSAIERCRTAALGGHVEQCGDCGHQRVAYNSSRNRNCPKCKNLARAKWLEDRQTELLDVPYFHVVFTVPAEVEAIAFQNQTVVYDILCQAGSETLRKIAADPKHLGAEIGFLAVLHTWGSRFADRAAPQFVAEPRHRDRDWPGQWVDRGRDACGPDDGRIRRL